MAPYLVVFYFTLFVFTYIESQTTTTDYCQYNCSTNGHTVCLRKSVNCGPASVCGPDFYVVPLTDADRQYLLDSHNAYRQQVASGQETRGVPGPQPSSKNTMALSYNRELEMIAQCHTNECVFAHDKCRRTPAYSWVGQNLAITQYYGTLGDYKSALTSAVNNWYNEVQNFNSSWVGTYGNYNTTKVVGHYTAFVWAKTTQVGCAMTCYTTTDGWVSYLTACNYGTGGNVIGQSVYLSGASATGCGTVPVNSKYPALCGSDVLA